MIHLTSSHFVSTRLSPSLKRDYHHMQHDLETEITIIEIIVISKLAPNLWI